MMSGVVDRGNQYRNGQGSVNYRPLVSNYQVSHKGSGVEPQTSEVGGKCVPTKKLWIGFICCFYFMFNSQGHIVMGNLWVEEPVDTSWSRFCTVNHPATANNYLLSNIKCPDRDSN